MRSAWTKASSRVTLIAVLLVALMVGPGGATPTVAEPANQSSGQNAPPPPPPRPANQSSKLTSSLDRVAETATAQGNGTALNVAASSGMVVASSMVRVEIGAVNPNGAGVKQALSAAGGKIEAEYADLVQALVPADALRSLSADPSIRFVRPATRPISNAITGEEIGATGASIWQASGLTGSGVKVGLIDPGFAGYQDAQAAGELPPSLTVVDYCGGAIELGGAHGTATAQIVHEIAPDAPLYLLCVASIVNVGQAIQYAEANGITLISESLSWPNLERGDGTGGPSTPSGIAADARAHGIFWTESAGNQQQLHWRGVYVDNDGDGYTDFVPGDGGNSSSVLPGAIGCAWLKWDSWPTTSQDYDLYIFKSSDNSVLASSTNAQTGTQTPTESICYFNTDPNPVDAYFAIYRYNATQNVAFDLFLNGFEDLQYNTPDHSVTEPATSPNVMAVGAVCWANNTLERYSSLGPTIDGRIKPDIAADDSTSSTVFGYFDGNCGVSGFIGTSAASPTAAGVAALVKQANPSFTPDQLQTFLEGHALDLGQPGKDNSFGSGRLQLGASPRTPCALPNDASVLGPGSWCVNPDGSIRAHTDAGESILTLPGKHADVDLRATVSTNNREASLVFRVQDAANLYEVVFVPDGVAVNNGANGSLTLRKRVGHGEQDLGTAHPTEFPALGQSARLRVVAVGSSIQVYLNDALVISASDSTLKSGRAGLRINGGSNISNDALFTQVSQTAANCTAPANASIINPASGRWCAESDGSISGFSASGDSILAYNQSFADVDFRATVSSDTREARLVFRVQDAANLYEVVLVPDGLAKNNGGAGTLALRRRIGSAEQDLATAHPAEFPTAGQSAQLRLLAVGSSFRVYLNGVQVLTATDPTFTSGKVGLRVNGDAGFPDDASFSQVTMAAFSTSLTVNKGGAGSGTVSSSDSRINCGSTCTTTYTSLGQVTLTATPGAGSTFGGWSGPCSGTGACQVATEIDQTVVATFLPISAGVQVNNNGPSLSALLTARSGCGTIDHIQFGNSGQAFNNAQVTISSPSGGPANQTSGFTYTPPAGTTSVSLTIQRITPSGGATVNPIHLVDGCGDWTTFVGGGPNAFH
jgi:hypothetical protein